MHFDAEKRTDMFVQGAQQNEETKLFHITDHFLSSFCPLPLPLRLSLAVASVRQSAAHENELHVASSCQGWNVHIAVDTQLWALDYINCGS